MSSCICSFPGTEYRIHWVIAYVGSHVFNRVVRTSEESYQTGRQSHKVAVGNDMSVSLYHCTLDSQSQLPGICQLQTSSLPRLCCPHRAVRIKSWQCTPAFHWHCLAALRRELLCFLRRFSICCCMYESPPGSSIPTGAGNPNDHLPSLEYRRRLEILCSECGASCGQSSYQSEVQALRDK